MKNRFQRSNDENICPNTNLKSLKDKRVQLSVEWSLSKIKNSDTSNQHISQFTVSKHQSAIQTQFLCLLRVHSKQPFMDVPHALKYCQQLKIYSKQQLQCLSHDGQRAAVVQLHTFEDILFSDYGELKVLHLCSEQGHLSQQNIAIVEYIHKDSIEEMDCHALVEGYYQLKAIHQQEQGEIEQSRNAFQKIVQKIKSSRNISILEKKINGILHDNFGKISVMQFIQCMEGIELAEKEILGICKYLLSVQNGRQYQIVQRRAILHQNIIRKYIMSQNKGKQEKQEEGEQLLNFLSQSHYVRESKQIIHQLMQQKQELLMQLMRKQKIIQQIQANTTLYQIEERRKNHQNQIKYRERIRILQQQNKEQSVQLEKYRIHLRALMKEYNFCE